MPTPAAQFSPALPWAAGTRGTITLREPVTKDDLLNGALTFIDRNGMLYQPEDNDGYVDYNDTEGNQQFSIAIEDEGEFSSLELIAPQDNNIQRVVVGPAVGFLDGFRIVKDNFETPQEGETGYILGRSEVDGNEILSLLTQDGVKAITAYVEEINENIITARVLNRQTAVSANATLKLDSAVPTSEMANLPKLKIEPGSDNNDFCVKVIHAPADNSYDGATALYLYKNKDKTPTYWGDSVQELWAELYS